MLWVHEPVLDKQDVGVFTPRREFNLFTCYRVFTSFRVSDSPDRREDVIAPTYKVCDAVRRRVVVKAAGIRVFYEGAEEDLDRYLLWLSSVFLTHEDDDPAPIYVARQLSCEAQQELTHLYPAATVLFVGPHELDHYGLLAGPTKSTLGLGLY